MHKAILLCSSCCSRNHTKTTMASRNFVPYLLISLLASIGLTSAWISAVAVMPMKLDPSCKQSNLRSKCALSSSSDAWKGEVVSNNSDGKIKGCSITAVGEEPIVEWIINIDGEQADLGRFSEAIYKKVTDDAKNQRFQGFRPGTIPPHLEPTYRAFAMDECARETVLEAMEQNNIRPFENTRNKLVLENFIIPPPPKKKGKKKNKKQKESGPECNGSMPIEEAVEKEPEWLKYENMEGAIEAGWRPGQSFSFVAKKVEGQRVLGESETKGARPLGLNY